VKKNCEARGLTVVEAERAAQDRQDRQDRQGAEEKEEKNMNCNHRLTAFIDY